MNFKLVALNPKSPKHKALYVSEWSWKPIRSMMAIANHLEGIENNQLLISYENLKELDENIGEGVPAAEACEVFAKRLKFLVCNPEVIEEYGMTVEMFDGEFVFTFPPALCTSAMQHKSTKSIINCQSQVKNDEVCSMLRATESDVNEVIDFFNNCGGFNMP